MKWVLAEHDESLAAELVRMSGLHPLIARLMVNRGITDPVQARVFLDCDLALLSPPRLFQNMERAAERIRKAAAAGEKIVVYGDYDVDGVTGTALLYLVLMRMGANADYYIPDRMSEGYGINSAALRRLRESGARLVITVDCGISARDQAAEARALGLDLIITDHHEIATSNRTDGTDSTNSFILPDAHAILHPWLLIPGAPAAAADGVNGLTGVGVALKLAQALLGTDHCDERVREYLDLVTLGTVADVGRITGENRVLVRHGLELLSLSDSSQRPGIAALKQVAGLSGKAITAGTVGFSLAPRINASGRLERADMAFRLLTTSSPEEASTLAAALDSVNRERQSVEELIRDEARRLCQGHNLAATGAFVLASPDWHPGVIGIVASRLVEEFYRPTALVCVNDGMGKGSARSIPGFDLYHGLLQCADLLAGFGGHKYAAGFTVAEERIPEFRDRLSALVLETVGREGFVRTQIVDGPVSFDELSMELVRDLEKLAPFGQGNPEPRLGARGLEVVSSRIVGNGHLKLRLRDGNARALDAIAFNRGALLGTSVRDGSRIAAVFTPRLNAWNGSAAVELEIRDLKIDKTEGKKMKR